MNKTELEQLIEVLSKLGIPFTTAHPLESHQNAALKVGSQLFDFDYKTGRFKKTWTMIKGKIHFIETRKEDA